MTNLNSILIDILARAGWFLMGWIACLLTLYVGWFFGKFTV
jgi:hypothetical protein